MPKRARGSGLFTLLTGMVMGATAVFFSTEKNRKKAIKVEKKIAKNVRRIKKDVSRLSKSS